MKYIKPVQIILFVLILDQVLKFWIKTHFLYGESVPVLGDWFILHFTENSGIAFGLEIGGETGKLILSIFRIVAATLIGIYLHSLTRKKETSKGLIISLSLILAGAIGNILDSAFYGMLFSGSTVNNVAAFLPENGGYAPFLHGRVVDMLYFPIISGYLPDWLPIWGGDRFVFFRPVFNIADSAITIGVFSILLFYRNIFKNI